MAIDALKVELCTGCGACVDRCPVKAIAMKDVTNDSQHPIIDNSVCINCDLCEKVCPAFDKASIHNNYNVSYIGYFNNKIADISSSGGIFAALAIMILNQGGVVYGATMTYKNNTLQCLHIRIDNKDDLHLIQGTKYVQSRLDGIYKSVKDDLIQGKKVLFSGTSCQVASLKLFVKDQTNLLTVDLVCHGFLQNHIFQDYVQFLEDKWGCYITNMRFRAKGIKHFGKEEHYVLQFFCKDKHDGKNFVKYIFRPQSAFYALFICRAGYRSSCYNCHYATFNKPSDITLGDFVPLEKEVRDYALQMTKVYSSIIVHTENGKLAFSDISNDLSYICIPIEIMKEHHFNLNHPSKISKDGEKYLNLYVDKGMRGLQNAIDINYYKNLIWNFRRKILGF